MKKIIFRVDANSHIATGHVMRCISYANFFRKNNVECVFVVADDEMNHIIKKHRFEVITLKSDYANMEQETDKFINIIKQVSPALVIIDSYFVTENYLKAVTKVAKTLYIDDLNMFDYPVDYLLNYSIYAEDIPYNKTNKKCFLGTGFVALREEFLQAKPIKINKDIKNIFITTGGADNYSFCKKFILNEIENNNINSFSYHLIVGSFFKEQDKEELRKLAKENENIFVYENVSNMQSIMSKCDVAISAGGSTLYELAYLGIPTIAIITAENQQGNVETFIKKNIMLYGGETPKQYLAFIKKELKEMSFEKRAKLHVQCLRLFDKDKKKVFLGI